MGEPICGVRMGGEREDGRAHMHGRGEGRWESPYALSIWEGRGKMGEPICCVHLGGEREDGRAHMLYYYWGHDIWDVFFIAFNLDYFMDLPISILFQHC